MIDSNATDFQEPTHDACISEVTGFSKTIIACLKDPITPSNKITHIALSSIQNSALLEHKTGPAKIPHGFKKKDIENIAFLDSHNEKTRQFYMKVCEKQSLTSPCMGWINWVPENFGFWMRGVALITAYLKEKYSLRDFYVCETLEGFSKKLELFLTDIKGKRGVFILACFDAGDQLNGKEVKPNFPQHKVGVMVEKNGVGTVKIALLDANPPEKSPLISTNKVEGYKDIWDDWETEGEFGGGEVVLRAILKANLPKNTELFYSAVKRQKTYGCFSFAIQDGLAFVRNPDFFKTLIIDQQQSKQVGPFPLYIITQLPPACMTGVQSSTLLQTYIEQNKQRDLVVKIKNGHPKTLLDYQKKYKIRMQNHYITTKVARYNEIVLFMLENMPSTQIEKYLADTFVE